MKTRIKQWLEKAGDWLEDHVCEIVIILLGTALIAVSIGFMVENNKLKRDLEKYEVRARPNCPSFFFQDAETGLSEALRYYYIDSPEIVFAQAVLETGHFRSRACKEDNNLFGLYNFRTKQYMKFKHWSESVEAYANYIQYKLKPNEDYYEFLDRIGYAEDPNYIEKVKEIVNQIKNK